MVPCAAEAKRQVEEQRVKREREEALEREREEAAAGGSSSTTPLFFSFARPAGSMLSDVYTCFMLTCTRDLHVSCIGGAGKKKKKKN